MPEHVLETQFGLIQYHDDTVLNFSDGLYGYETNKRYLLWEQKEFDPFKWLICLDKPSLMFPVVNPKLLVDGYHPQVSGLEKWKGLLVVLTIGESTESATANLRAPILILEENKLAKQVILADANYSLQHPVTLK